MDVSKNGGTQQPWVFLLKMIILGCFGGTPIFGNTHILTSPGDDPPSSNLPTKTSMVSEVGWAPAVSTGRCWRLASCLFGVHWSQQTGPVSAHGPAWSHEDGVRNRPYGGMA